jgi:hypothetical protein
MRIALSVFSFAILLHAAKIGYVALVSSFNALMNIGTAGGIGQGKDLKPPFYL